MATFLVDRSLLVHNSDFFLKALTGDWQEAIGGVVKFDDIDPKDFQVFVEWLSVGEEAFDRLSTDIRDCTRAVQRCGWRSKQGKEADEPIRCGFHWAYDLLGYYTLGDRLMASRFKNAVITSFIKLYGKGTAFSPSVGFVTEVYELTMAHSIFRRVLVDFHVRYVPPHKFHQDSLWPRQHTLAVAEVALKFRYPYAPAGLMDTLKCYHEH